MYNKKTWTDRMSEYPNRRTLTKEDGSTEIVSVERNEGEISSEGDAFSAENMNDLEERINQGFESTENILDTLEEIEANTEAGKIAGALAVKEINESLTNENGEVFRFAYQDGKRGMWIKEADTDVFVPFNQLKSQTKSLSYTTVYGSINSASLTFDELQEIKGISSISSESDWIRVNGIKSMTINENTIMLNFVATDGGRNIVYDITAIGI